MTGFLANADVDISAPPERVWSALTDPKEIAKYMFGASVEASWRPGGAITWNGEYEGRPYQDKGEVLEVEPPRRLKLTHFSPLTGQEDRPENYHTVSYELTDRGGMHAPRSQSGQQRRSGRGRPRLGKLEHHVDRVEGDGRKRVTPSQVKLLMSCQPAAGHCR